MSENLREKLGRQILVRPGDGDDDKYLKWGYYCLLGEAGLLIVLAIICRCLSKWKDGAPTRLSPEPNIIIGIAVFFVGIIFLSAVAVLVIPDFDDDTIIYLIGAALIAWALVYAGYEELLHKIVGGDTVINGYSTMVLAFTGINALFFIVLVYFVINGKQKAHVGKYCLSLGLTLLAVTICFFNDHGQTKVLKLLSEGDVVTIGEYEQDGDSTNGAEGIRWKVLNVDDSGVVTLVAEACLELLPYDGTQSWANSNLRRWLNEDFYERAFNSDEKKVITDGKYTVSYSKYDATTESEGKTDEIEWNDKVFLLSKKNYNEPEKEKIINGYSVSAKARRNYIDCYGKYKGAYYLCDMEYYVVENAYFPIYREENMREGARFYYTEHVDGWKHGMLVRPVITVKLLGNYEFLKNCKVGQR